MAIPPKPIKEMETDCAQVTKRKFELECTLMDKAQEMFIEIMDLTIRTPKMSSKHIAILALSIKIFRLFQCIREELMSGYYEVAESELRSVFEHVNLVTFFSKYEDNAHKWLKGTKYDQKTVREKLTLDPELRKAYSEAYSAFSNYASHPQSIKSLATIIEGIKGKTWEFIIYPKFNQSEARFCFSYSIHWYWYSIIQLHETFARELSVNKDWIRKYGEWDQVFTKYMMEEHEANKKHREPVNSSS